MQLQQTPGSGPVVFRGISTETSWAGRTIERLVSLHSHPRAGFSLTCDCGGRRGASVATAGANIVAVTCGDCGTRYGPVPVHVPVRTVMAKAKPLLLPRTCVVCGAVFRKKASHKTCSARCGANSRHRREA